MAREGPETLRCEGKIKKAGSWGLPFASSLAYTQGRSPIYPGYRYRGRYRPQLDESTTMVEYESFEDVLGDLDLNEDELKRLVSEGSLRAYRDDDRMKFRKDDIENLRRSNLTDLGSQPTVADDVDMGDGLEVVEETDETVLDVGDLSDDVDFEDTGSTSVPTVELDSGIDGDDATLTEELTFDTGDEFADADATLAMDEGVTLDEDDLGLETEPLGGLDDGEATVVDDGGLDFDDDLGMDDGLDLDAGGDEFGGQVEDFGGEVFEPAAPVMAAPQVQVQERIKYVEILPSETWWTKLIGIFVLLLLGYTLFAVFGVEDRDESVAQTANVGFNFFKGTRSDTLTIPMRPAAVTNAAENKASVMQDELRKPANWITAPSGVSGIMVPGQELIRTFEGTVPATLDEVPPGESLLTHFDKKNMSPAWMADEMVGADGKGIDFSALRRATSRPAIATSAAPANAGATPAGQ